MKNIFSLILGFIPTMMLQAQLEQITHGDQCTKATVTSLSITNNILHFSYDDCNHGSEIWNYDGINAELAIDVITGGDGSSAQHMYSHNSLLYFAAFDDNHGGELWVYDGSGAELVMDIWPGDHSSFPSNFLEHNDILYFLANNGSNGGIYSINGSEISLVIEGSDLGFLSIYNNNLVFAMSNTQYGRELWQFDVDDSIATLVADINSGPQSSNPGDFCELDGVLYFRAQDGNSGYELWSYNGQTVSMIQDIWPGEMGSEPSHLTKYNDQILFNANDSLHGVELWRFDGASADLVEDFTPGVKGAYAFDFEVYANKLFFTYYDSLHGSELYEFDGLKIKRISDLNAGSENSEPVEKTIYKNRLYFMAQSNSNGYELWRYSDPNALGLDFNTSLSTYCPNPTSEEIRFEFNNADSREYRVLRLDGSLIESGNFTQRTFLYSITQPSGIYLFEFIDKKNIAIRVRITRL